MTPRLLLVYVALGIIVFNLLTVRFRERNATRIEKSLRKIAERKGGEMTLQEISSELHMPLYDAKILMRKFTSKGKVEVRGSGEKEVYVLKDQS